MDILKKYHNFKRRIWLEQQIRRNQMNLRVVVGSSDIFEAGWVPTDINTLDLLKKQDWESLFKPNSIQAILAEHVWEHLTLDQGLLAAQHCFHFLINRGFLRIAVPDGFHPDPDYINYVKVNGIGPGADDHKMLFTYQSLSALLTGAGFKVHLLEYFDEKGDFHAKDWDPASGKINRSIRFDRRNQDGLPHYTSLIVDGIKEHL